MLEALAEVKHQLRGAVGRQARVKRTPDLVFRPDDVQRGARRIDEILYGRAEPTDDDVDEA